MTGLTCGDLLARADRHLAPELAGRGRRARLLALAETLPAALASSVWLECRLAGGDDRVDLSLRVPPSAFPLLAGALTTGEPLRERIRSLARRALEARGRVAGLWLEHDLDDRADSGGTAIPGVFVELARPRPGAPACAATVATALECLLGGPPPRGLLAHLRACFRLVPREARVAQLGVMLSRGEGSVRLCTVFSAQADVPPFLARLGWPGPRQGVERLMRRLRPADPGPAARGSMMVQLEVSADGILPRLGIDYPVRSDVPDGHRVLDRLVEAGLADPGRARGVRAWPGARTALLPPGHMVQALVRRVGHLKVAYRPGAPLIAKAYLTLQTASLRPVRAGAPAGRRAG